MKKTGMLHSNELTICLSSWSQKRVCCNRALVFGERILLSALFFAKRLFHWLFFWKEYGTRNAGTRYKWLIARFSIFTGYAVFYLSVFLRNVREQTEKGKRREAFHFWQVFRHSAAYYISGRNFLVWQTKFPRMVLQVVVATKKVLI